MFSAIVGLPWNMTLATMVTGYTIVDQSAGTGPGEIRYAYYTGRPEQESFLFRDLWAFRCVDLRLQKGFDIGEGQLRVVAEAFNIFDFENYDPRSYNGNIPAAGQPPNPDFGLPTELIELGRRLQFGVTYSF